MEETSNGIINQSNAAQKPSQFFRCRHSTLLALKAVEQKVNTKKMRFHILVSPLRINSAETV